MRGPFRRSLPPKETVREMERDLLLLCWSFLRRLLRRGFLRCHRDLLRIQAFAACQCFREPLVSLMSPRRSLLTVKFLAKSALFVKRKIAFGKRFFEKKVLCGPVLHQLKMALLKLPS